MPVSTKLRAAIHAAGAPAFSPADIAGLVGWFDATQIRPEAVDPASLSGGGPDAWFKADALSLNDDDPIGTWDDSSAGGHQLTAAGSARPVYKTNILNGKPVARFDGTDASMAGDSGLAALFAGGTAATVYVVCSTNAQTTIQMVFTWNVTGGTGGYILQGFFDDASARWAHLARRLAADTIAESVGPTTANGQYRAYFNSDAPAASSGLKTYYDGANYSTGNHATNGVFGTGSGTFRLGSTNVPDQWLNGDVAEVIVWTRILSTLERRQIDRYLSDKYALAGIPSTDADQVSDWIDLSGQLRHTLQGGNQRPVYKTNIQNGLPVVRFAAASSQYIKSAAFSTLSDPLTLFVVAARSSTSAANTYFDGGGSAGYLRGTTATPKYRIWAGTATGTSDTSWHQISAVASASADALYVDGATIIAASAQGAPAMTAYTIGSDIAGGNYFNGDIGEVLIYDSALSTPNRQLVEAYLKAKWGTP